MTLTARYHTQRYGIPLFYGSGGVTGLLAWGIQVDWDNDGVFDGSNETGQMIQFTSSRGRKKMIKKYGSGFEVIAPGHFVITLKNDDGRYDKFNTSSPLYPYIQSGVDVKIEVTDQATLVKYSVIYGIIENIVPSYYKNERTVKIYCVDTSSYLAQSSARVPVQTDIAPEDAMDLVLDYVNWPARWGRTLGVTADVIPYYWSNSKKQALTDLQEISEANLGYFFIDNSGRAKFVARTDSSASVVDFDQSTILRDIGNDTLYDNYRNVLRIKVHPRSVSSLVAVYETLGKKPYLEAGATEEIWGDYAYNSILCPAINLVTPVATTDYLANTAEDGSGTNKTANISVTFTNFGDTCKLVVTNNDAGPVYITMLKVRGYALYEQNSSDITYPLDVSTVTNQKELTLDLVKMQDVNVARGFANSFGLFLSTANPTPTIIVEARPDIQFLPDLFDTTTLTILAIGINGVSFRVSSIEHETLDDNCQAVRTVFYLEPYIAGTDFWTWPATDFGVDTIFGW